MEQADDFLEESRQIFKLLRNKSEDAFSKVTLFKSWTINDVIGHLQFLIMLQNVHFKVPRVLIIFLPQ